MRRSTRRQMHDPHSNDINRSLAHAHSDPELRHLGRREFEISRQELRDSRRTKNPNLYENEYQYDCKRCPWDCPCHRECNEPRQHKRTHWDFKTPSGRYSTRSERWTHSTMYEEEFERDHEPRYSYSLPRGRQSSRRIRAKTVDPRLSENQYCPHAHRHAPHHPNRSSSSHYEPTLTHHHYYHQHHKPSSPVRHIHKSPSPSKHHHEHVTPSYCHHHKQQQTQQQTKYEVQRELDADMVRKTPIITNRYAIEEVPKEMHNLHSTQKKLRSHSMPRATYLHPHDALYVPEDETGIRRLKRSRAMSVMPRHGPYIRGELDSGGYELSEMRPSLNYPSHKIPACTDCCLHEPPNKRDYYIVEPLEKTYAHEYPPRGSYNSHTSYHGKHNSHNRNSRKVVRHERAEKLPPSPRIMSPMGFAVKRQTRQRPSFEIEEDSLNGWQDYNDGLAEKNRPVPIWLCVFLVISYILGGALLFKYWEKWTFLNSAYFCFITLTTIGFGDLVPAKGVKDESEQSIAYCSLYLLFGIALLAMSFNLVQEEFIANVKEVARRLGIINDEEDDDN